MKKIFLGLFIVIATYSLFSFAIWYLNDGFSLSSIQSNLKASSKWEVKNPPDDEIRQMLSQNFYYLGKGSQCYVFESEDKQIVLKFFRHSRFRLTKINDYFTFPAFLCQIRYDKLACKQKKLDALFQSCKIAFEELQEESGLLYLHLTKGTSLQTHVTIYDKLKKTYTLNIDDYEFIIQKHAEQIFPYLTHLLKKGKKEQAKEALTDLVSLLITRLNKGIADHDAVIHKNSGFSITNKPLFLDVGEFSKEPCLNFEKEIWQTTYDLRLWLEDNDKELAQFFDQYLNISQIDCACQSKTSVFLEKLSLH